MDRTTDLPSIPTPIDGRGTPRLADPFADHLESLEQRLADGYARIEDARRHGQDVTAWEEFWIDLLHQYEAAVDGLPEAA